MNHAPTAEFSICVGARFIAPVCKRLKEVPFGFIPDGDVGCWVALKTAKPDLQEWCCARQSGWPQGLESVIHRILIKLRSRSV
jgi:hypothetical protein